MDKLDTNQTQGIQMKKKEDLTYFDILNLLQEIKVSHPNLRFGQIISNAMHKQDIYYSSDKDLLNGLQNFNAELSNE